MKAGDIVLVPFPYAEFAAVKVRPAVVVALTADKYEDVVVSAVSSVVPNKPSRTEIVLMPNRTNKLRAQSVIKVDRIVTFKQSAVITQLGKLSPNELQRFKAIFRSLVD